jgi:long-subunit fatty acid transport protein
MVKKALIILFLLVPFIGNAQIYKTLPNFYRPIDSATIAKNKADQGDKTDFGVTVGTGFSSFSGNSMMQSYVAPHFNYKVNDKLQLNFSGVIANSNTSILGGSQPGFSVPRNGKESYALSGGSTYQATENFQIRMQGTYVENSMQPFNLYPQNRNNSYKSFSFGMGYKFNENTSIGVEFRVSDGYNPYYSPYYNSYNRNPFFFNDPFR